MKLAIAFIALTAALAMPCSAAVVAANDPNAQFNDGMFLLPDLASPKDSYLIIIEPKVGDPIQLTLPPGSNGIRLSRLAQPTGEWSWKYKVAREVLPTFALATPKDLTLANSALVDGRFALAWVKVPGAKKYLLSGKMRTKVTASDDPEWGKLEASCFASVCARSQFGTKAIELKPGSEVNWQVSAVDEDGITLAQSESGHIQVENTWVQAASKAGLKLQRSDTLNKTSASLPATFSYISSQKGSAERATAYQSEFALIYEGSEAWSSFWPRVSLEGRLTSAGEQKSGDALKLRAGGYRMIQGSNLGEGTEFVSNIKYETESKTGTKKGLVELGFTPVYGWLGRYWPGPPKRGQADAAGNYTQLPWLQVAPVISFGAELGKTMSAGTSSEKKDTIVRLRTTLRFDVELNALSSALGTNNITGYLEGSYWRLPREDDVRNYRVGKAGLSFGLTDQLSIDLAYSVGREAPTFNFSRAGSAGLGFKF